MFLEVNNLRKYYGQGGYRHLVLDGVTFYVERGEICIIVGSSGGGKSTLLNCIGGLETADGGTIQIENTGVITSMTAKQLSEYRRDSLGFVFQFYNLIPDMTVAENIDVCKYLSRSPLDRNKLLKLLNIEHKKNCFPNTLSGGEQQRCAIARALVKNPEILICDEPTGALDSKTARDILHILEEINKIYGTTVLMVTHNNSIIPMADRVVALQDGKVTRLFTQKSRVHAENLEDI